jgi:hypothetical protein
MCVRIYGSKSIWVRCLFIFYCIQWWRNDQGDNNLMPKGLDDNVLLKQTTLVIRLALLKQTGMQSVVLTLLQNLRSVKTENHIQNR